MTPKKLLIILLLILILVSIGVSIFLISKKYAPLGDDVSVYPSVPSTAPEKAISQAEIDKLPGCVVAFTEISPDLSDIHIGIKTDLEHYRKSWQDVCSGKKERSLYSLWVEAKDLMRAKNSDFTTSALCKTGQDGECLDITYFTPGIDILTAEGMILDFAPSQKLFAENVKLGTQEDKDFFTTFALLNIDNSNNFPPWIEQTWDYGGCTLYGSYDWIKTLNTLDDLSKKIKNSDYLDHINSTKNSLVINGVIKYLYTSPNHNPKVTLTICTCNKKEAVLSDIEKVLLFSKSHSFYDSDLENKNFIIPITSYLNDVITKIQDGRIQIASEVEGHCSGG